MISYIDIDKIISVKTVSGAQQDKNNCTFHVATDGRTYELQAHDEATMNKYVIDHTLYVTVSKLRSIDMQRALLYRSRIFIPIMSFAVCICTCRWISSLQYLKEWRAKQKREANK